MAWHYAPQLIRGALRGGKNGLSCYDVLMIVAPGSLLTVTLLSVNLLVAFTCLVQGPEAAGGVLLMELQFLLSNVVTYYCGFAAMGLLTVLCEWDQIRAGRAQKIGYVFTFPLFMMTYIPIAVAALRRKVEWKPIEHHAVGASLGRRPVLDRTA